MKKVLAIGIINVEKDRIIWTDYIRQDIEIRRCSRAMLYLLAVYLKKCAEEVLKKKKKKK